MKTIYLLATLWVAACSWANGQVTGLYRTSQDFINNQQFSPCSLAVGQYGNHLCYPKEVVWDCPDSAVRYDLARFWGYSTSQARFRVYKGKHYQVMRQEGTVLYRIQMPKVVTYYISDDLNGDIRRYRTSKEKQRKPQHYLPILANH